jgi:hypothetical protein
MTKDVNLVITMPKVPSQNCSDFHQFMTIMTGANLTLAFVCNEQQHRKK